MIGQVVGTYKIVEKAGEGGMGEVFRGIDLMLEREVAIKKLSTELASEPKFIERFRSEAVTLAKLNHKNITSLHSFMRVGNNFYMVMEFIRGKTLKQLIKDSGPFSVNQAIALLCQALDGIAQAHRLAIIHRDLKSLNIMLENSGYVKVMDFGLARVLGTPGLTTKGGPLGTPCYMSPEQILEQNVDDRTDIYALGILLYEMLTGRLPFSKGSQFEILNAQLNQAPVAPRHFRSDIPLFLETAILRAMQKKPENRFQTADEFRKFLLMNWGQPSQDQESILTIKIQSPVESTESTIIKTIKKD